MPAVVSLRRKRSDGGTAATRYLLSRLARTASSWMKRHLLAGRALLHLHTAPCDSGGPRGVSAALRSLGSVCPGAGRHGGLQAWFLLHHRSATTFRSLLGPLCCGACLTLCRLGSLFRCRAGVLRTDLPLLVLTRSVLGCPFCFSGPGCLLRLASFGTGQKKMVIKCLRCLQPEATAIFSDVS